MAKVRDKGVRAVWKALLYVFAGLGVIAVLALFLVAFSVYYTGDDLSKMYGDVGEELKKMPEPAEATGSTGSSE